MRRGAFLTVNTVWSAIWNVRLSIEIEAVFPRVCTRKQISLESAMTIGRIVRLCGESGVNTMLGHIGAMIGPPALSE